MTTLAAVSDQSGELSAMWGWKAWLIFIVAVVVLLGGWALVIWIMSAPERPSEPSRLDVADGRGRTDEPHDH